jgi:hypothetical protein
MKVSSSYSSSSSLPPHARSERSEFLRFACCAACLSRLPVSCGECNAFSPPFFWSVGSRFAQTAEEYSPFLGLEKGAVLQEARVFHDPHVDARRCAQVRIFSLLLHSPRFPLPHYSSASASASASASPIF